MIIAIDPGPKKSAVCLYDPKNGKLGSEIYRNEWLVKTLKEYQDDFLAIEMIACYGMAVGAETFDTCVWIGRFIEAHGKIHRKVYRSEVKIHICGSMKAKDTNIRQALIDRFGGLGTKNAPGKLYGFSKDKWSALAVALTAAETQPTITP